MDSVEMLKQLLDKFTNESALIEEELKLVQEQINELEARLSQRCEKKEKLASDKDKVLNMLHRYATLPEPAVEPVSHQESKAKGIKAVIARRKGPQTDIVREAPPESFQETSQEITQEASAKIFQETPQEAQNEAQIAAEVFQETSQQASQIPSQEIEPEQEAQQEASPAVDLGQEQEETDGETVKSINAALRSLFR